MLVEIRHVTDFGKVSVTDFERLEARRGGLAGVALLGRVVV
jgi:hypothetical protein